MRGLFLYAFNMSITAGYFILAIVLFRFIFRKAPKWVNCLLWGLVGLRLLVPFSLESPFSFLPTARTIITNKESSGLPFSVESGIYTVDANVNDYLKSHYYEGVTVPENTFFEIVSVLAIIWLIGVVLMLAYSAISFIRLKKQVAVSILYRDNIYYCDNIGTPFILGAIRPKIYIPSGLEEGQIENIVMHENSHLKRKDHWWKPLGFLILAFYWFNPLIWLAYILLCRDIEKACDEKVVKNMNAEEKKGYLETLVDCSIQRKMELACPVAFGEVGVKQRVRAVVNYKKPAFWIVVIAVVATVVASVGFLTMPEKPVSTSDIFEILSKPIATTADKKMLKEKYPQFFDLDYSDGLTAYVTKLSEENYKWYLSSNKNSTDIERVAGIILSEFADTKEMGKILYTYDIGGIGIEVVPIQHNLSSYWEYPQYEADELRESVGLEAKEVWIEVDRALLENLLSYDEISFYKDTSEYNAIINLNSKEDKYIVIFTESQYNKFMEDKYNEVALYYCMFGQKDEEGSVIRRVEFDKDFRNLKIYIDKELYLFTSFDQIPFVVEEAYSYQLFLEDSIGVNVEIIDRKTNKVLGTCVYP